MITIQLFRRKKVSFLLLISIFFFLCAPVVIGAENCNPVTLSPREWGRYRASIPGEDEIRWEADWVLECVDEGPPARYIVRDELRGRFGEESTEQIRVTEAGFLLDRGLIRMQNSLLTVRDREGKIVFTLEKEFDYKNGEVRTRIVHPEDGETEVDEFEMDNCLVDNKAVVSFLRGFPFPSPENAEDADEEIEFTFLNESPDTYSILVTYEGIEDVKTPAGTFTCHKLRMVPDMGILTFIGKIFAPDIYIWFTAASPHFWVKYEGVEGDEDTPSVISELVEFNTDTGLSSPPSLP